MKLKVFGLLIWTLLIYVESYRLADDCPDEDSDCESYFRGGLDLFDIQQGCPLSFNERRLISEY